MSDIQLYPFFIPSMLKLEKRIIIQKLIIKRILNKNKKYPSTDLFGSLPILLFIKFSLTS
jgi:hypothetical protein